MVCLKYHLDSSLVGLFKFVTFSKKQYTILSNAEELKHAFPKKPPRLAYRRDRSLKDILVHSRLTNTPGTVDTVSCGRPRCVTCDHVDITVGVDGPTGHYNIRNSAHLNISSMSLHANIVGNSI